MKHTLKTSLSLFVVLLLPACFSNKDVAKNAVIPEQLAAPPRSSLILSLSAQGVQIYKCIGTGKKGEWVFSAPEAELFDKGGTKVGRHFAGPTWELKDGSKVVGAVLKSAVRDESAIPWLLLSAKSTGKKGQLSAVHTIQRTNTVDGKAPAGACAIALNRKPLRVPYTADYNFYSDSK